MMVARNTPAKNNEAFAEFQFYRAHYYQSLRPSDESAILSRANAFAFALDNMTLSIEGMFAGSQRAAFPNVYHHHRRKQSKTDCYPNQPKNRNKVTGGRFTQSQYRESLRYWNGDDDYARLEKELLTEEERGLFDSMKVMGKRVTGHMIPDYESVLQDGLDSIIAEAKAKREDADGDTGEFYDAVITSSEAVIRWAGRYADLAESEVENFRSEKKKNELKRIATACRSVPRHGANSFYEALQSLWIMHSSLMLEQMTPYASSLGRFDQYMYPFFYQDTENGEVTETQAKNMLIGFFKKTCEGYQVSQNLLIGGVKWDYGKPLPKRNVDVGKMMDQGVLVDATNSLSRLVLTAVDESGLTQPSVALRYHNGIPEDVFEQALDVGQRKGGMPAFHNDHSVIPAMVKAGYGVEDAVNFVVAGCQEPTAVDDNSATTAGRMSLPAIVRDVIFRGRDGRYDTFEKLMRASKRAVTSAIKSMVTMEEKYDRMQWETRPVPLLSGMMASCMEKGVDYRQGGTRYNYSGCFGVGLANTANMLAGVKNLVYEEGVDYNRLVSAIDNNWRGEEELRQRCFSSPKFGKDLAYVDDIANELFTHFCKTVSRQRNARGGIWKAGFNTPTIHVLMGEKCEATPDGRYDGDSFAYGTGPMMGTTNGVPTEIIKSVGGLPQERAAHGTDFELAYPPDSRGGSVDLGIVGSLVKTYMGLGGHHLQLHSMGIKELRAAQVDPKKYWNMVVRVHGFSARFVLLDSQTQEDIIGRLEGGAKTPGV